MLYKKIISLTFLALPLSSAPLFTMHDPASRADARQALQDFSNNIRNGHFPIFSGHNNHFDEMTVKQAAIVRNDLTATGFPKGIKLLEKVVTTKIHDLMHGENYAEKQSVTRHFLRAIQVQARRYQEIDYADRVNLENQVDFANLQLENDEKVNEDLMR